MGKLYLKNVLLLVYSKPWDIKSHNLLFKIFTIRFK